MSLITVPAGDVTLMFTDIEGSTRAWDTYHDIFRAALRIHDELVRSAIANCEGFEVKATGDGFMVAFSDPLTAALCALEIQSAIESEPFPEIKGMRVRIGLHTGTLDPHRGDYFGPPVNRAARIMSAAHGGMVLISEETAPRIAERIPSDVHLLDLGLHRLKDLGAPQRLYRMTRAGLPERTYPRLRTLDAVPHNFPAQITEFIGRKHELIELGTLLASKKSRLITVTGTGGTGKTRLAMQAAVDNLHYYDDGVWLVELAGVTQARDVPTAVALALGIPLGSDADARTQVFGHLQHRKALLVLDNFEQVVEAARFINELLKQCPDVVCLISSRFLLHVAGEAEFSLEPMPLPPVDVGIEDCLQYESIRLFVERGQGVRSTFAPNDENLPAIAAICRRLEGLPLAVELTASLVRGMTPQQILPRLSDDRFRLLATTRRDLEPRQRSLRGAIDSSYELLSEDERMLFTELSVFSGGFSIDVVDEVCTTPGAFELIFELRDKSLLKTSEMNGELRYTMLETLREYALEKLKEEGRLTELRDRHAMSYLHQTQQWSEQLEGSGDAATAMRRTIMDLDNIRTGMDWAVQQDDCTLIMDYGRAVARFFLARGLYSEGDRRLAIAEHHCRQNEDKSSLARLLLQRGRFAFRQSRLVEARALYQESYDISKSIGETARLIPPLISLGNIAWAVSDFDTARTVWEEALALARETKQTSYEATLVSSLGILASGQGDFEAAAYNFEAGLKVHRRDNNQVEIAQTLMHIGDLHYKKREFNLAFEKMAESRDQFLVLGRKQEISLATVQIALILLEQGKLDEAEVSAAEGLRVAREIASPWSEMYGLAAQGCLRGKRGDIPGAFALYRQSCHIAVQLGDRNEIANLLKYAGYTLRDNAKPGEAFHTLITAHREYAALHLYDAVEVLEALRSLGAEQSLNTDSSLMTSSESADSSAVRAILDQY